MKLKYIQIFNGKKYQKNASYKCLSLIMQVSVVRVNKRYYLQTFLEECKYEMKRNRMENLTNYDLNPSSSDESDNEFDNESENGFDNESDNNESDD